MDYFEIFLPANADVPKSAEFFGMRLRIAANEMRLL